ncbi:nucleotidyltransferase domain-containing protein [Veronia pacifica]|uniref:Polymerase nucleotidyl transferase domain-containing protein n=1 Tax=Veronia pacifica TaxID=1080227 RepID=A0A1C3ER67_9GAMM|nr:nucleotidyltransferase domain-containing protein [Veronia pacifica]ODA35716.1 hypothetical protein A8L45_03670 [Veronia pacifica]
MSSREIDLSHLPLQQQLVESACRAFENIPDVIAAVLVGSLAAGKGDRVSDADIVIFTQNSFHKKSAPFFSAFESEKDIFYCLDGFHTEDAYFKKYIFHDFTSIEIHCLDLKEPFELCHPFKVLFNKTGMVKERITDQPAPKHQDFEAYTHGDKGIVWELFDCIKWLSRDDTELAKSHLKKLAAKM